MHDPQGHISRERNLPVLQTRSTSNKRKDISVEQKILRDGGLRNERDESKTDTA